ncbi:hypothetical protein C8R42DRAFT_118084 [Lentinula raphanica]|nr:hypothetical protein C8R42DRAFT_118084 [Lentinula raphanica]
MASTSNVHCSQKATFGKIPFGVLLRLCEQAKSLSRLSTNTTPKSNMSHTTSLMSSQFHFTAELQPHLDIPLPHGLPDFESRYTNPFGVIARPAISSVSELSSKLTCTSFTGTDARLVMINSPVSASDEHDSQLNLLNTSHEHPTQDYNPTSEEAVSELVHCTPVSIANPAYITDFELEKVGLSSLTESYTSLESAPTYHFPNCVVRWNVTAENPPAETFMVDTNSAVAPISSPEPSLSEYQPPKDMPL